MLLVNLGFWQLGRGEEKLTLEKQLASRSVTPHIAIDSIPPSETHLTGLNVSAMVIETERELVYWDNQIYDGKVGYLVYQLFQVVSSEQYLLVELGFVATKESRAQLPDVPVIMDAGVINGRIYARESNPLSSQLMPEFMSGLRIQNLNFEQLADTLQVPLYPFALQPTHLGNWPLAQPWKPLPLSSSKHFGYAVQWFVMALVWLMIALNLLVKKVNQIKGSER